MAQYEDIFWFARLPRSYCTSPRNIYHTMMEMSSLPKEKYIEGYVLKPSRNLYTQTGQRIIFKMKFVDTEKIKQNVYMATGDG